MDGHITLEGSDDKVDLKKKETEVRRENSVYFHIRRLSDATLHQGIMHPNGVCWVFDAYDADYNPVSVKRRHMFELILDAEVGSIEFATDDVNNYADRFPEIFADTDDADRFHC